MNFEIEKLKIEAEANIKIATATAQIMANVGQNAEFVHIGGESTLMGSGASKTGNILLDTLSQIPMLMKSVNVQNQALNGKPITDEIRELSDATLAGLGNLKKGSKSDSGKEEETTSELNSADAEGEASEPTSEDVETAKGDCNAKETD